MGVFATSLWLTVLAWSIAGVILVLDVKLLVDTFTGAGE
jgi:manganese transport protein